MILRDIFSPPKRRRDDMIRSGVKLKPVAWLVLVVVASGCGEDSPASCELGVTWLDQNRCVATTTCTASEYAAEPPTLTTDRRCEALTVCSTSQYESSAPSATQDRTCAALTVCNGSQFESRAATATTDRACSAVTTCDGTEFEVSAPTAMTDRVCATARLACSPGEYDEAPPTPTSDRVCTPCATDTWDHDGDPLTVCVAATTCLAGQYEWAAPSAVDDRVCRRCRAGEHCPGGDSARTICDYLDTDPTTPCTKVVSIDAGFLRSCAVDDLGDVACWGRDEVDIITDLNDVPPSVQGSAVNVSVGETHACAVDEDGTVQCWGYGNFGQLDVPPALADVTQLAVTWNGSHACALTGTGQVSCWGTGPANMPTLVGPVEQISAGATVNCAIQSNGAVACWGAPPARSTPPPLLTPASHIDSGNLYSCAIDGGFLSCWGDLGGWDFGQTTAPAGLGAVTHVSVGMGHTCAIDMTGEVTCWGAFCGLTPSGSSFDCPEDAVGTRPVINTPTLGGRATLLTSSASHTCALNEHGSATCWGTNQFGQTDVPRTRRAGTARVEREGSLMRG
jgi:hypothetical protein